MVSIIIFPHGGITKTHPYFREQCREDEKSSHRTVRVFVTSHPMLPSSFGDVVSNIYALVNKRQSSRCGGKGRGGNINLCTLGKPPHHLSKMPPSEAFFLFCHLLPSAALPLHLNEELQRCRTMVKQNCLLIHGTATQSRFTLRN